MSEHETMINHPNKKAEEATGLLSKMYRKILSDIGMNSSMWNKLMLKYLDNPQNRVPRSARGRSSVRGNLNKELAKEDMTWANFEKGLRFLNPIRCEFSVKLHFGNGRKTDHTFIIGEDVDDKGI